MKTYNEMFNIGMARYVVNYHDGIKTHGDNSKFYDVAIFKNVVKKNDFVKSLLIKGYEVTK